MITTGHLCSGYDGLGLALDQVEPHRPLWHAELDPFASQVLAREQPLVPNIGDLKQPVWDLAPPVDLLCSGDPCQSISVAGRQLGREDPRFLWPRVRAIYREVKPFRIFLENVANMVSHDQGRTLRERLDNLREDGYAARWTVLGACTIGAPHHRHRWFLVADYVGAHAPEALRVGDRQLCGAPRSGGRTLLPSPRSSDHDRGAEPDRAARTGTGGTLLDAVALLPTPMADRSGTNVGGAAGRAGQPVRPSLDSVHRLLPTPRATDGSNGGPNQRNGRGQYDALPGLTVNLLPTPTTSNAHGNETNNRGELLLPGVVTRPDTWGKYASAVALWEQVTGVPAPDPTEIGPSGGVRLSPLLPEWMMGLTPGYLTKGVPRAQALKLAGNGVVPLQAAAAYRMLTS